MRSISNPWIVLLAIISAALPGISQLAFADDKPTEPSASDIRLREMTQRVERLFASSSDKPGSTSQHKFVTNKPLFRYSEPSRNIVDATVWRLGAEGRPKAILVLERYVQ